MKLRLSPTLLAAAAATMGTCIGSVAVAQETSAAARPAQDARMHDRAIPDDGIRRTAERELLFDEAVSPRDIDIRVEDGVVTLSGSVDNLLAKERAVRVVETVRGVRAVVNMIGVEPENAPSDRNLRQSVRDALLRDPATDSYEIRVETDGNGHVTLSGTTESWTEKQLCATVAKSVRGVRELTNDIDVNYKTNRPDRELQAEVKQALRWDALVDDGLVNVEVENALVKLTGTVGSTAEKRQARWDAWVSGVADVDDSGLEVARWARDEDLRKDKYVYRSDDELKQAIERAFVIDPRVKSFHVDTAVEASGVTLSGVVDNLKAKRAAAQDARNTVGTVTVYNQLKVRPKEPRSDPRIESDVRSALLDDPFVDRHDIEVDARNGIVYLRGSVDTLFEKSHADDVASRVKGVMDVVNTLDVVDETAYAYDPRVDDWRIYDFRWYHPAPLYSYRSDARIRGDIEDELWWSPFVDSDDVHVKVEDGVATLTGKVDSWSEYSAARENAYEGGATYVRNRLELASKDSDSAQ